MLRCNGCLADDDYDDFGHFIFKAHFEKFREFVDSPTQEVSYKTLHGLYNETTLNVLLQLIIQISAPVGVLFAINVIYHKTLDTPLLFGSMIHLTYKNA